MPTDPILTPPPNIRVWQKRPDAIGVDWKPLPIGGVTYVVEYSADGGATWQLGGKSPANYVGVGGLVPGKSYAWRVTSVAAASSAPSATIVFPAPAVVVAPPAQDVPAAVPAVLPPAPPIVHGGISDDADFAAVATLYRELGLTAARIWFGVDAQTGAQTDTMKLARLQTYRDGGVTPRIVMQPSKPVASPAYPAIAVAQVRAQYPRGGEIEVGNEGNWQDYFAGGYLAAARWASPVIDALGDDYVCSPPSMTGWFASWEEWTRQTIAAGLCKKARKLCYHLYSNKPLSIDYAVDPVGAQGQIDAYFADSEFAIRQALICQGMWLAYTGRLLPIDVSEWGAAGPQATLARVIPAMVAMMSRLGVAQHAYYITTLEYETGAKNGKTVPKPTPAKYGWLVDRRANVRREPLIAAIKAAIASLLVASSVSAKSLYFNAGFEPSAWPQTCPPGYRPANVACDGYTDAPGSYASYWIGGAGGPRLTPDPVRIAAAAKSWPAGTLVVLDEMRAYDTDSRPEYGALDPTHAPARNAAWSTAIKAANPTLLVGNYNGPPLRADLASPMLVWRGEQAWSNYVATGTTHHDLGYVARIDGNRWVRVTDTGEQQLVAAWQHANDLAAPALVGCDVIAQSLYLFNAGADGHGYAESQIAEMRRMAGGRPVIVIVYPVWCGPPLGGQRIDLATFAAHVDAILALADGVLLWGCDASDPLDQPYIDLVRARVAAANGVGK